ncbi:tRNA (adenosine(37)-N6)-threonylcarbamoyltransferase complex ATPase subunit type 1 TsaE [Govanella unica]|uniref:tRNA threonylcarbamoyladenosine biosynthesis protein TsaE n=1 Tax=Govanella unica TaxID=2975056 RepID=A0A9X3TZQ5_9PROT|nr:tRNA (adenosine(37)-N6)-threonylcarbamoyltransferase complex ATPase subunit type 1 TsaE [Govania unica]MDA5194573.1 tRNA (adenosine(37)-N6)-threonylcarbamoyltransferase complex ATPase subunit type 1 TsaE [Govania unica]
MRWTVDLPDLAATQALAELLEPLGTVGDVITLEGDLGAGKTAFARAFIQARFGAIDVPSPTFNLVLTYGDGAGLIWHFDLYRLEDQDEVYELGFEEALDGALSLIEWPERLGSLLPVERLSLTFEMAADDRRSLIIDATERWARRLQPLAMARNWVKDRP